MADVDHRRLILAHSQLRLGPHKFSPVSSCYECEKLRRDIVGLPKVVASARQSSLTRRSWRVRQRRSTRPEAAETSRPFHADPSQLGTWLGTVDTSKGKLPARMQITGNDHMQIGSLVPVENLGVEEGFLSGGSCNQPQFARNRQPTLQSAVATTMG